MPGQDREKQERLLHLAGWLHHKHRWRTIERGDIHTEVRFTRDQVGMVPALAAFSPEAGDAGERAMNRAVKDLREFGLEVEFDEETQEWVSRASALSDDECKALAAAALYVLIEDGSPVPDGYHIPGAGLSVEGAELIVAYAPVIDRLLEAIRERTPVSFNHRGAARRADPWHVFMLDGRWYLIGRDHEADDRRAFAIDAIDDVETSGSSPSFEIPRSDWIRDARIITDPDEWQSEAEPIEVQLDVDPRLVGRAESILGASVTDDEQTTGWVSMICEIRNVDAFINRLWALRGRSVVKGPAFVRQAVVEALRAMT